MKRSLPTLVATALVATTISAGALPAFAQPPTPLATNFTLVNMGNGQAQVVVNYYQTNGSPWGNGPETVVLPGAGSQAIFRQYDPPGSQGNPNLTPGQGSVVVSSDQPLAAVVQIRPANFSSTWANGAYSGLTQGTRRFFVPLVAKQLGTASGIANSQIVVQNLGSVASTAVITLVNTNATVQKSFTTTPIQPGASLYYDLSTDPDVGAGWYGSAVVEGTSANVGVVSNFFTGFAMQTFNAFPETALTTQWFIPLFTYRLSNGLSTPIAIQNLSGTQIPQGGIQLRCKPGAGSPGAAFTATNITSVGNSASYFFNPVTGAGFDVSVPNGFYGSCTVSAPVDVVVFVQMRFVTGDPNTEEAAAYEAFPQNTTSTSTFIPLVAKRLGNGFATAVTIQNLDLNNSATITVTYQPGQGSPSWTDTIVFSNVGPGEGVIQNHRLLGGVNAVPNMPEGWFGTMRVESDRPIASFVQLTYLKSINPNLPNGDFFAAHNAFGQ